MYESLPPIRQDMHMDLPHFPSRFHAAVFRLWETVPAERIAHSLALPLSAVQKAADEMGLPPQGDLSEWTARGYITTIRNAWHVLPYENLLPLLGWSEDQLATAL
ncbi:MAG: hypothetical protein IKZ16_03900 [Clostridia bacterium]|nr:hypothetical protein [Clostridia bacterium]